jgi:hypothetical protein
MAASVSEAASFEGFDFVVGRVSASGGACIFREALGMDHLDLCAINAKQVLVLRGNASITIEVCLSEPATHAKTPREIFFTRRFASREMTSLPPAG